MEQSEITREELEQLLGLAHAVVVGTGQATLKEESAYLPTLLKARKRYYKAWIDIKAAHGQLLSIIDTGGCSCGWGKDHKISDGCMYHYAARLQPDNHRIPWNCPTYYDGCNCEPRQDGCEDDLTQE